MKKLFLMIVVLSSSIVLACDSGIGSPVKGFSDVVGKSSNDIVKLLIENASCQHKTTFNEKGVPFNFFEQLCSTGLVNRKYNGTTALHEAVRSGRLDNVAMLLYRLANPNVTNSKQETPLHIALAAGREDIAERLITAGALKSFSENFLPLPFSKQKAKLLRHSGR